ncbi:FtsX-like permease family protein [Streptomyces sp. P10-4]|uniref:ABC transporter permease n=1 Tax=Streptomyces sp. P10-4 TaxID=3421645 RepID=UPI003D2BA569
MTTGLARAQIRSRPSAFVGTFVALLFGALVIICCGHLLFAAADADQAPQRYAAVPVLVAADPEADGRPVPDRARVDVSLAGRIAALPQVKAAVADTAFPVTVSAGHRAPVVADGRPVSTVRFAAAGGDATPPALAAGRLALDAGTARELGAVRGATLRVTASEGTASYRLEAVVDSPRPGVWFADAEAWRLSGHPNRADAIAVLPKPGVPADRLADQVRKAAGSARVLTSAGDRNAVENPDFSVLQENTIGMFGAMGGLSLYIAIFVVANTMALSISQRQRETALLRGIGARPAQIRRTAAAEASLVAVLAVAVAVGPGYLLARVLFDAMESRHLMPPGSRLEFTWIPVAVAAFAGLLAAVPGSLIASFRAARSRPAQALGEAAVPRRGIGPIRLLIGLAALAGAVLLTVTVLAGGGTTANNAAPFVLLLFMVAVSLLGPLLARLATEVLGLPLRLTGVTGELATLNGRARARRLSSAIVPVALVVAFGVTKVGQQTSLSHEARVQSEAALSADRVVEAPGGLPQDLAERAARVPGVAAATGITDLGLLVGPGDKGARPGKDSVQARAFTGAGGQLARNLDPDVVSGSLSAVRPAGGGAAAGTVAVEQRVADRVDTAVGRPITLWLGDGTRIRPVVAATYKRGTGVGDVLLPQATVAGHLTSPLADRILVRADGSPSAGLDRGLESAVSGTPGATVQTARAFTQATQEDREQFAWLEAMALGVITGFAGIAAANTLAMVTFERLREVSMLRLIGMNPRRLRRVVRLEALTVVLAGLGIGMVIALIILRPLVQAATGASFPYLPPALPAVVTAVALVVGLAATMLPLRRLLRVRPTEGVTRRA